MARFSNQAGGCLIAVLTGTILNLFFRFAGDEADSLVANAGADPSTTTLTQLFERQGGQLALGTTTVKAISTTYQHAPGGSLTSVVLVQHSSPMEVLDEGGITRLRHAITGKLVACCDVLPTGCMTAFTTAGCLAVLAPLLPTSAVPGCTGAVLTDFFKLLYAEIQNGGDCIAALEKAEAAQPALAGIFKLFW